MSNVICVCFGALRLATNICATLSTNEKQNHLTNDCDLPRMQLLHKKGRKEENWRDGGGGGEGGGEG